MNRDQGLYESCVPISESDDCREMAIVAKLVIWQDA